MRLTNEMSPPHIVGATARVATLILLDRDLDYVTPMATQLTYEGLIDEFFKISSSKNLLIIRLNRNNNNNNNNNK